MAWSIYNKIIMCESYTNLAHNIVTMLIPIQHSEWHWYIVVCCTDINISLYNSLCCSDTSMALLQFCVFYWHQYDIGTLLCVALASVWHWYTIVLLCDVLTSVWHLYTIAWSIDTGTLYVLHGHQYINMTLVLYPVLYDISKTLIYYYVLHWHQFGICSILRVELTSDWHWYTNMCCTGISMSLLQCCLLYWHRYDFGIHYCVLHRHQYDIGTIVCIVLTTIWHWYNIACCIDISMTLVHYCVLHWYWLKYDIVPLLVWCLGKALLHNRGVSGWPHLCFY